MRVHATRTYRVGLNALLLDSGRESYRRAGIHNYLSGLLPSLTAGDNCFTYTAFVSEGSPKVSKNTSIYRAGPRTVRPSLRVAWEQFVQPWVALRQHIDLLHSMAFVSPVLTTIPSVVTVYDLSFLRVPDRFRTTNRIYLSLFTRVSCRRARRVITISESTKRDVVTQLGIPSERIDVIYPGIHERFRAASPEAVAEFRVRRGLPEEFILYLGTIEPRKNLSVLINAFAKARPSGVKLICAGGRGWMYEDVFRTVEELRMSRDVIFPGLVPADELPLWYSAARAFVYPSSYEGFGMPVLEALACSVPTIATNAASLPEVTGESALLVPPENTDALSEALSRILTDANLRAELAAAGPIRAEKFLWPTAGRLTVRSHAQALGLPTTGVLEAQNT